MIIAGTIKNSVNLAVLDNKWQQKKQNLNKSKEDLTAEERELKMFQEQADSLRESRKPNAITSKLQAGGKLTPEEIEYLKKNNPQALKEYQEIQKEREGYKKQLKKCKSKEEVEKLKMTKMGQYMAAAKKTMNDPYILKSEKLAMMQKMLMKISAIEIEHEKFLQSLKFAKLPDEEKEAKKEKTADDENLQNEKADTTAPDATKEVAGQESESENAEKIGGNIDLKL